MTSRERKERTLLVVENDPHVATAVEKAGEKLNMSIERATDGWDAIEKLEENDYAAIVVDLDVPQSSGYGVVTFLRQEYGHSLDKVILMTQRDHEVVRGKVHEPCCRIIRKTDSVDQIVNAIADVI